MHKTAVLALLLLLFVAGCQKPAPEPDPFFEKWRNLAAQSQGHSPAHRMRDLPEPEQKEEAEEEDGRLPTQPVTMKLHNAEVTNVIQALARAADINVVIHSGVEGNVTMNVKNTPWNQVFQGVLRSQGLYYAWEGELLRILTAEDLEKEQNIDPLITRVVTLDYAQAPNMAENLEKLLTRSEAGSARGSVAVDSHTNSLIIQATRQDVRRLVEMVNQLDQPRAQIQLKAHIVETTAQTARDLGVQWGGLLKGSVNGESVFLTPGGGGGTAAPGSIESGNYNARFGEGLSGQGFGINLPATGEAAAQGLSLGFLLGELGGNILETQLSALQERNKLKILSSPSITTMDNQTAYTENGARVPYVTESVSGGVVTREVNFEDVVLRLEITPHVIERDKLKLDILVKKDEVDLSRSVDGNPFIIKKTTETRLITRSGETVVISGLTKNTSSRSVSGVPAAKDIPVLGWLFKNESRSKDLEEVLIFITPYVLPEWELAEPESGQQG